MNITRAALLGVAGAAVAALIAGATTPERRPLAPPPSFKPTALDQQGAALASEIERLRERLRPTTEPRQPSRNLFRFGAAPRPDSRPAFAPDVPPPMAGAMPAPLPPRRPPLLLVGIAEDVTPEGTVRTAILTIGGDMHLAKLGDELAGLFRVTAITGQRVDLTELDSGAVLHLDVP